MRSQNLSAVFTLALSLSAATATAAPKTDVEVTLQGPGPVLVDAPAQYQVLVENISNRRANDVRLTIQLPETHTSPQVYVLGQLSNVDPRCSLFGTVLDCDLGRIGRFASTTVGFDLAAPFSTAIIEIDAIATTSSNDKDTDNNSDALAVDLTYYAYAIVGTVGATVTSCTGQGLTSFYDCIVSPSSTTIHYPLLEGGGGISFPNQGSNYGGSWSQTTTEDLHMEYTDGGTPVVTFDGKAVGGNCFDGIATFNGPWVAAYRVCI